MADEHKLRRHPVRMRTTKGETKLEVDIVLEQAPDETRLSWNGTEPRRVEIWWAGERIAQLPIALNPGDKLVIRTLPPTPFDRALALALQGSVTVIEDDSEPG